MRLNKTKNPVGPWNLLGMVIFILFIFQFRELLVSLVSRLWFTLSLSVGLWFCSLFLLLFFLLYSCRSLFASRAIRWIFSAHNFIGFFRTWTAQRIQIGTIHKPSKINDKKNLFTKHTRLRYFIFDYFDLWFSLNKIHNYFYTLLIMARLTKEKCRETIINVF